MRSPSSYLNRGSPGLAVGSGGVDDVGIAVEELADALAGNRHHLQVLKAISINSSFIDTVALCKRPNHLDPPHVEPAVLPVDNPKGGVHLKDPRSHF